MSFMKGTCIVTPPGKEYFGVSDLAVHNITRRPDPEKAISQHSILTRTLRDSGFKVYEIPELKDHPNYVFTRDTSLFTDEGYIKLQMGLKLRRGEKDWMAQRIETLGIKKAGSVSGNGTVEGEDVIIAGAFAIVGLSKRTNREGVNQLYGYIWLRRCYISWES
jgi:dimethylargininase